jgi:hypothetical protein
MTLISAYWPGGPSRCLPQVRLTVSVSDHLTAKLIHLEDPNQVESPQS